MVWHLPSTVKDLHIANFHRDWLADHFRSILLHRNLRYGKDFEIPNMTLTLTHYWSLSAASIVNLVIIVASPVRISVFSVVHRTINFSLNFLLHDQVELRFLGGSYVGFYRSTEPQKCQCIFFRLQRVLHSCCGTRILLQIRSAFDRRSHGEEVNTNDSYTLATIRS